MVVHTFNPSTWETGRFSEFEASLVYRMSSRTARAIQRNPVSKKKQKQKKREYYGAAVSGLTDLRME